MQVPVSELIELAVKGAAMRRAQKKYFASRRLGNATLSTRFLQEARDRERAFDDAVEVALAHERPGLPDLD